MGEDICRLCGKTTLYGRHLRGEECDRAIVGVMRAALRKLFDPDDQMEEVWL